LKGGDNAAPKQPHRDRRLARAQFIVTPQQKPIPAGVKEQDERQHPQPNPSVPAEMGKATPGETAEGPRRHFRGQQWLRGLLWNCIHLKSVQLETPNSKLDIRNLNDFKP
jgi:hypothetical protein